MVNAIVLVEIKRTGETISRHFFDKPGPVLRFKKPSWKGRLFDVSKFTHHRTINMTKTSYSDLVKVFKTVISPSHILKLIMSVFPISWMT